MLPFELLLSIVISYFLGSIPSGYIFSNLSKKDILKIGWRKTSGSNVFKNVGKWQGIATIIFDVAKGFAAVYLANILGLSVFAQILSGLAVVVGHNWSCFIKFSGGRGIASFIGTGLALSPKILAISVFFFAFVSLIWVASIGTIVFLVMIIFLSLYFREFSSIGLFTLLSLFPIFIKRLSPIRELFLEEESFAEKFGSQSKKEVIRNRLIFDDDIPHLNLRIKEIIKK